MTKIVLAFPFLFSAATSLLAADSSPVVVYERFDDASHGWTKTSDGAAAARWEAGTGFAGRGAILLETKAVGARARWRSPAVRLVRGQWYRFAIRYRARVEHSDVGRFRLDFEGAQATPKQVDELVGVVTAPRMDMRFPDLAHWQVKQFWIKPAVEDTIVVLDTRDRYDDQTMWFDDMAIVAASGLADLRAPRDGAIVDTTRPTLVWLAPFGAQPTPAYTVVLARNAQLTEQRRLITAAGRALTLDTSSASGIAGVTRNAGWGQRGLTLDEPLAEGTWFWSVWPTMGDEDHPAIELASEVRSFYVRHSTAFMKADTTPPHVYRPQPLPDTTVDPGHMWLACRLRDEGGSGIDLSTLSIQIDGRPYGSTKPSKRLIKPHSVRIAWSADPDTAEPPRWLAFPPGIHRIDVSVADKAGNIGRKTWQFGVGERVPAKTWIDNDGRTFCNGLPFFPVALYLRGQRRPDYWEWVDNGANTLINWRTFAGSIGAKALVGIMSEFRNNENEGHMRRKLAKLTAHTANSNAVLGYWLNETHDELTAKGFTILKELDPNHFNLYSEGWGFAEYGYTSDGYFYNDYAVPSRPITSQLPRSQKAQAARKPGQTVWYINQGHDYAITFQRPPGAGSRVFSRIPGYEQRPNGREMRAMAHLAMVGGDMGMSWWAPLIDLVDEAYIDLLAHMREFSWIGPVYWETQPGNASKATWDGGPHRFLMHRQPKLYVTERQTDEARYLMAVNVDTVPLVATFTVPGQQAGDVVQALFEDRALTATSNGFTDEFAGPQAHVYRFPRLNRPTP